MNTVFVNSMTDLFDQPNSTERVDQALCGTTANILEQSSGWYYLETCYGYRGWVQKSRMRPVAKRNTWDLAPKLIVLQAMADVLIEPRVQSACLITAVRGCILGQFGAVSQNGWQHVCLPGGEAGWIPAAFLSKMPKIDGVSEKELRERVTRSALSYLGTQYRWGGKSPAGIDCSGLVQMAYQLNGVSIWRDAEIKPGFAIHEIDKSQMKSADLLYFPGHVAMYLGNGKFVHATGHIGDNCVTISSLDPYNDIYRKDLAENITAVGSVFPLTKAAAFTID
ncbi:MULTISPECIES: C40 family peptidase [Caproicibacterium]|uniref:C40 family peptidase n=1 Tax=Caproicibacterium argilliputei TaxID=3030016 RepID=A0AA97H3P2_9FIRM|nr:C40 family peptidase [Caproicibacterium argilliputei]WOC32508.1 C40 family peptidase [Caproicibacterium argilliputei]